MKKNMEKIFATASVVVAFILIMILLVTAFGGIKVEDFQSELVQGLMVTLAVLYLVLAIVAIVLMFINSEVVKEIIIRSEQKGSNRVSVGVVRKLVKDTCKKVDGVSCKKVSLVSNEYGVRLKVSVKAKERNVDETEIYLRTLLEDEFLGALGFKFHSIEIKFVSLVPAYKSNEAEIKEKADALLEERKEEEASYAQVEESAEIELESKKEAEVVSEQVVDAEKVDDNENETVDNADATDKVIVDIQKDETIETKDVETKDIEEADKKADEKNK